MPSPAPLTIRLNSELVAQIDELAEQLKNDPKYAPTGTLSRSNMMRTLLMVGLEEVKRREGLDKPEEKS